MKNFFKILLAVFCGFVLFTLIGIFVLVGIAGTLTSKPEVSLKDNTVLVLPLKGSLQERSVDDAMTLLRGAASDNTATIGLDDVLTAIERATANDQVKGIYLKCGALSASPASLEEIRSALLRFKENDKFVVAYADTYTQGTYQLASLADEIYLNPSGMIDIRGFALRTLMLHGALDKLGVQMQVVKVGTYKSAVEPYILDHISPANREQLQSMSQSLWGQYVTNVTSSRGITPERLNEFANKGLTFAEPTKTVEYGLVDTLVYESAVDDLIARHFDGDKDNVNYVSLKEMINVSEKSTYQKDKVAVLYAVGQIDGNTSKNDGINSQKLCAQIKDLINDDNIKAVVFRVNSPGGSAYGSEQIWEAIGRLREKKPVIVSMGDYAASGGYYISCQADTIIAEPSTLTGSIGIFGLIPNFEGTTNKIGINMDVVSTNEMSDMGNTFRPMTTVERDIMQNYVNRGYELFVKRCADGRSMTIDGIKAIAEGRVWTGEQALKNGLVDLLGNLDDAIRIAAEKANLEKYNIAYYPQKKDLMTQIMEELNNVESRLAVRYLGEDAAILKEIELLKSAPTMQARMPYYLITE